MAYDDRSHDRNRSQGRWRDDEDARREWRERETRWQGDDSFGGGWGNQTAENGGEPHFARADEGRRGGQPLLSASDHYGFGGDSSPIREQGRGDHVRSHRHDPHYSEWREREIAALDRDYDEYRRENQSRFDREFAAWRDTRGRQREAVGRVTENMEVVGADGGHVGAVDKVRGDTLILNRKDPDAGGVHHAIPCGWIDRVEDKVILNLDAEGAKSRWREEGRSRALFERADSGSDGPRNLNRAFSGTYREER